MITYPGGAEECESWGGGTARDRKSLIVKVSEAFYLRVHFNCFSSSYKPFSGDISFSRLQCVVTKLISV